MEGVEDAEDILDAERLPLVEGVEVMGKSSVELFRASLLRSKMERSDLTTQSLVGPW